jgi:hypothetical protein
MQSENPAGAGFVRTAMPSEHPADADKHRRSRRALVRLLRVVRNEGHPQKYRALNLFCQGLSCALRSADQRRSFRCRRAFYRTGRDCAGLLRPRLLRLQSVCAARIRALWARAILPSLVSAPRQSHRLSRIESRAPRCGAARRFPHFILEPAERTTCHLPARFSSKSIHRNTPSELLPSRIRFSVTLPFDTATLPNTCTSMGPFSND